MVCSLFILFTISRSVSWFMRSHSYCYSSIVFLTILMRETKYRETRDNIISWSLHYWNGMCSTCYRFHENKARDHPHYEDWAVAQAAMKVNRKLSLFVLVFLFILSRSLASPSREVTLLTGVWESFWYCCKLDLFVIVSWICVSSDFHVMNKNLRREGLLVWDWGILGIPEFGF